jgi:hypothetical protein
VKSVINYIHHIAQSKFQFLWIVHLLLPLRYSLTFIHTLGMGLFGLKKRSAGSGPIPKSVHTTGKHSNQCRIVRSNLYIMGNEKRTWKSVLYEQLPFDLILYLFYIQPEATSSSPQLPFMYSFKLYAKFTKWRKWNHHL